MDIWESKFTRDKSTTLVNEFKYPFIATPTIQQAVEYFISTKIPDVFGFVVNKDDKGRVKMYEKYAKVYSSKFNYKTFFDKQSDFYAFVLYKNDEFEKCALEILQSK